MFTHLCPLTRGIVHIFHMLHKKVNFYEALVFLWLYFHYIYSVLKKNPYECFSLPKLLEHKDFTHIFLAALPNFM